MLVDGVSGRSRCGVGGVYGLHGLQRVVVILLRMMVDASIGSVEVEDAHFETLYTVIECELAMTG